MTMSIFLSWWLRRSGNNGHGRRRGPRLLSKEEGEASTLGGASGVWRRCRFQEENECHAVGVRSNGTGEMIRWEKTENDMGTVY
jgi:hypothetical protein